MRRIEMKGQWEGLNMLLAKKPTLVINGNFQVLIWLCQKSQLYSESFSSHGELRVASCWWSDEDAIAGASEGLWHLFSNASTIPKLITLTATHVQRASTQWHRLFYLLNSLLLLFRISDQMIIAEMEIGKFETAKAHLVRPLLRLHHIVITKTPSPRWEAHRWAVMKNSWNRASCPALMPSDSTRTEEQRSSTAISDIFLMTEVEDVTARAPQVGHVPG